MRARFAVGMLSLFMLINFADKAAFGLAAVPIMRDLHLSNTQFGALGGSFFALFSLSAAVVGSLSGWISTRWLIAGMALIWTFAQLPLLGTVSLGVFFASRILLGAGEGPAFPTALHAAFDWFSDARRPLITGIIAGGGPLGAALSALVVTWVIVALGWHAAFGMLSAASLLWCIVWLATTTSPVASTIAPIRESTTAPASLAELLRNPTLIGVTTAGFAFYCISALALIWLPPFLQIAAGLSPQAAGRVLMVAWLVQVPLLPLVGWFSVALRERGYSSEMARVAVATAGLVAAGVAMIGMATAKPAWLTIALAVLSVSLPVTIVATGPSIVAQIAAGPQRGIALGSCIGFASLGGAFAPVAFGKILDAAGSPAAGYHLAFVASGVLVIGAAVVAMFIVRPTRDSLRPMRGTSVSVSA